MGLYIGNIQSDSYTKLNHDLNLDGNGIQEGKPIYGCIWDGKSSVGTRLYAAKDMKWSVSSSIKKGEDDFQIAEDGKSPFHVWKGVETYDTESKKHTIVVNEEGFDTTTDSENVVFEADPEKYNSLIVKNAAAPTGNRVCIYKKAYWSRPSKWCWMVSNTKYDGFSCIPAFYRKPSLDATEKKEYKYLVVSEYKMSTNGNRSQPGAESSGSATMDSFRNVASGMGMKIIDYQARMYIVMMACIKYANLNSYYATGLGHDSDWNGNDSNPHSPVTGTTADNILGLDGYGASAIDQNGDVRTMGLCNFYGDKWEFLEGIFTYGAYIYNNSDWTYCAYPSVSDYEKYGFEKLPIPERNPGGNHVDCGYINDIVYDKDHPEMMYPVATGGDYSGIIGDNMWASSGFQTVLIMGGSSYNGSSCSGLFAWLSVYALSIARWCFGARCSLLV